jgi:DNA-damage-inducible protein J
MLPFFHDLQADGWKVAGVKITLQQGSIYHYKTQPEKILHSLGLSASEAFDLYYRQIILNNGLPFDVRIPNKATLKATIDSHKGRGKKFKNINELFKDLGV